MPHWRLHGTEFPLLPMLSFGLIISPKGDPMRSMMRKIFGLILAAAGACNAQTSPAKVVFEPAPIGVATTGNTVLFSQPFSTGQGVPRGVYAVGAATPLVPLPPSADAENYFVVSPGLGGFAAGSIYAYGLLNGSPTIFRAGSGGGAPSTFISNV